MLRALTNGRVLTTDGFKSGQSVTFENGNIVSVCDDDRRDPKADIVQDLNGAMLVPGFVDVQLNGGGGVLFNDQPTLDGIRAIAKAHYQFGTTGFLPTLISDNRDVVARAIQAVSMAIEEGVPGVLGIHLEGPFLNKGKRGVHNAEKIIRLVEKELGLFCSLKRGKTLITLAPELTPLELIEQFTHNGIVVSAGHSQATFEQALDAMDAGLRGFTHLFNAMRPLQSRDPGLIAAALQDPRAWCGIIPDGAHVHPAMLNLAYRAKRDGQIFLVTDAMPSVGTNNTEFQLDDQRVQIKDGMCLTDNGTLAGSNLNMNQAVLNAQSYLDIDFETAVRLASLVPARFMGLEHEIGEIAIGKRASFCLLNSDFRVQKTWIDGALVFE